MPIQRHHKVMIGSFSSIVVIFMITTGFLLYSIHVRTIMNEDKISELQIQTNSKINQLTDNILETRDLIDSQVKSLNEELTLLKASAGEDFSGIIEESIKSVVTIRTDSGQGTGFIIEESGYIVTNAHVLADDDGHLATGLTAITSEQNTRTAKFIGYNGDLDIALLKISGDYDALELANSNKIQVGEKVIAIGNPLGLQFSVSEGIVSAVHRKGISDIEAYIQTDAALNPGNSGGPLINKEGKVIGINNFKISTGESLGFSLESNYIKSSVNEIALSQLNQTLIQ